MVLGKGETAMKLKLVRTGNGARTHYAWNSASRFFCGTRFSWSAADIKDGDAAATATCKNCRTVRTAHTELHNLRITTLPRILGGYEMFCQGIHLGWVTEKRDGHRDIVRAKEWGGGEVIGYCGTVSEAIQHMRIVIVNFMFPQTRKGSE